MISISDLISFDPTSIVITRHAKVPSAGGFSTSDTTLDAQTVRLYFYTTRNQFEVTLDDGEVKRVVLGVLAEEGADIVVGHDSWDTFTVDGREYRIVGVREYDDSQLINIKCVQADCVAV